MAVTFNVDLAEQQRRQQKTNALMGIAGEFGIDIPKAVQQDPQSISDFLNLTIPQEIEAQKRLGELGLLEQSIVNNQKLIKQKELEEKVSRANVDLNTPGTTPEFTRDKINNVLGAFGLPKLKPSLQLQEIQGTIRREAAGILKAVQEKNPNAQELVQSFVQRYGDVEFLKAQTDQLQAQAQSMLEKQSRSVLSGLVARSADPRAIQQILALPGLPEATRQMILSQIQRQAQNTGTPGGLRENRRQILETLATGSGGMLGQIASEQLQLLNKAERPLPTTAEAEIVQRKAVGAIPQSQVVKEIGDIAEAKAGSTRKSTPAQVESAVNSFITQARIISSVHDPITGAIQGIDNEKFMETLRDVTTDAPPEIRNRVLAIAKSFNVPEVQDAFGRMEQVDFDFLSGTLSKKDRNRKRQAIREDLLNRGFKAFDLPRELRPGFSASTIPRETIERNLAEFKKRMQRPQFERRNGRLIQISERRRREIIEKVEEAARTLMEE